MTLTLVGSLPVTVEGVKLSTIHIVTNVFSISPDIYLEFSVSFVQCARLSVMNHLSHTFLLVTCSIIVVF